MKMELHNVSRSGNAAIRPYSVTTMPPPRDRTFSLACGFEARISPLVFPFLPSSCLVVVIFFWNSPSPIILVVPLFNTTDHETAVKCKKILKTFLLAFSRCKITLRAWESATRIFKKKRRIYAFYSSNKNDENLENDIFDYLHVNKILKKVASNDFSMI